MATYISSINVGEDLKSKLMVKVVIARSFMWRMKLAAFLLGLVAHICPLTISLEHGDV